jgi:hypothetical protein
VLVFSCNAWNVRNRNNDNRTVQVLVLVVLGLWTRYGGMALLEFRGQVIRPRGGSVPEFRSGRGMPLVAGCMALFLCP